LEPGEAEMFVHVAHTSSSSLLSTTEHGEATYPKTRAQEKVVVPVIRLDDYVSGLTSPPEHEILIKLDVQGFEGNVLKGAPSTLSMARACIAEVSLEPLYEGQSSFDEIYEIMKAKGLAFSGTLTQLYSQRDGHVTSLDAVFVRP
jgi:hypothetical protein